MKTPKLHLAMALVLMTTGLGVAGNLVTFDIEGHVNRVTENPVGGVIVGDPFTGTLTYDLDSPDWYPNDISYGHYIHFAPLGDSGVVYQVRGIVVALDPSRNFSVQVSNGAGGIDGIHAASDSSGVSLGPEPVGPSSLTFILRSELPDALTSDILPTAIDVTKFPLSPELRLQAWKPDLSSAFTVWFTATSITRRVANQAPVAQCKDVIVAASGDCTANASIDNGSFDPDSGDTIELTQSPPGPYPLGNTPVTLAVTDSHGASLSCTAVVTVVDTAPPAITTPNDLTVNADSLVGAVVTFETPITADNCSVASVLCNPASGTTFPVGTTTVTCTASDAAGNSSSGTFTVRVKGAVAQLTDLIASTEGLPINRGLRQSLAAKLRAAKQALDRGHEGVACLELRGFLVEVRFLVAVRKLTPAQAAPLIADAGRIRAVIGCP